MIDTIAAVAVLVIYAVVVLTAIGFVLGTIVAVAVVTFRWITRRK